MAGQAVLWGFSDSFPEKKLLLTNVSAFQMHYIGTWGPEEEERKMAIVTPGRGLQGPGGMLWTSNCSSPDCQYR